MSRGRKILVILTTLAVVFGGGVFLLYHKVAEARKELDAIVEPMLKDMAAAKWDKNVMNKYESPKLKLWVEANKASNDFSGLLKLGNLKEYKGLKEFMFSSASANLVAEAQFDTGEAEIALQMSQYDNIWLINRLNITSPALLSGDKGKQDAR